MGSEIPEGVDVNAPAPAGYLWAQHYPHKNSYKHFADMPRSQVTKYVSTPGGVPPEWIQTGIDQFSWTGEPTQVAGHSFYDDLADSIITEYWESEQGTAMLEQKKAILNNQNACIQQWNIKIQALSTMLEQVIQSVKGDLGTDFSKSRAGGFPTVKGVLANHLNYPQTTLHKITNYVPDTAAQIPGYHYSAYLRSPVFGGRWKDYILTRSKSKTWIERNPDTPGATPEQMLRNNWEEWRSKRYSYYPPYYLLKPHLHVEDAAKLPLPNLPAAKEVTSMGWLKLDLGTDLIGNELPNSTNNVQSNGTTWSTAYPSGWATMLAIAIDYCQRITDFSMIIDSADVALNSTLAEQKAAGFIGLNKITGPSWSVIAGDGDADARRVEEYEGNYKTDPENPDGPTYEINLPERDSDADLPGDVYKPVPNYNYYADSIASRNNNPETSALHKKGADNWNENSFNHKTLEFFGHTNRDDYNTQGTSNQDSEGRTVHLQFVFNGVALALDALSEGKIYTAKKFENTSGDAITLTTDNIPQDARKKVTDALQSVLTLRSKVEEINELAICILRNMTANALLEAQITQDIDSVVDFPDRPKNWRKSTYNSELRQALDARIGSISGRGVANVADTIENAEDAIDRRRILVKEQCFLMNFVDIFSQKKIARDQGIVAHPKFKTTMSGPRAQKRWPYHISDKNTTAAQQVGEKNASLLISGDPYAFINRLTLSDHTKTFMNLTNAQLSLLQPMIRLYKVVFDDDGDDAYDVEIPFGASVGSTFGTTKSDIEMFTQGKASRGVGVGIKDFVFSYEGSNPFAVKKSIKGRLRIFANNMTELLRERKAKKLQTGTYSEDFRYVDLALKTGGSAFASRLTQNLEKQNIEFSELNFRLKAQVGWALPTTTENEGSLESVFGGSMELSDVRDALRESFVTLNLTPTVHNFDFDEMGRVTFNIDYLAYVEQFFDTQMFNIFANAKNEQGHLLAAQRLARQKAVELITKDCKDKSAETANALREDFKSKINDHNANSISFLSKSLVETGKLKYINLTAEQVIQMRKMHLNPQTRIDVEAAVQSESSLKLQDYEKGTAALTEEQLNEALKVLTDSDDPQNPESEEETAKRKTVAKAILGGSRGQLISYFYVSDLIDMILVNIDNELEALSGNSNLLTNSLSSINIAKWGGMQGFNATMNADDIKEIKYEYKRALKNYKRMRILLGPLELRTKRVIPGNNAAAGVSENVHYVNFGDIPIATKYFFEFLTEKMIAKNENFYSLTRFLNDFFNLLVKEAVNGDMCVGNISNKQHVRMQQATITSHGSRSRGKHHDPVTKKLHYRSRGVPTYFRSNVQHLGRPILRTSGPEGARTGIPVGEEYNFFVYSAGQTMPLQRMKGNRNNRYAPDGKLIEAGDESRGIYHYLLGRDRGLIKNIKLTKTQTKGLAEVRFEQDGYDGLQQLRVVYDVQIDTFANVQTYPGTYLFVDPRGFAPASPAFTNGANILDLTKIGIGGYYMIYRSEHSFGPGKAESTLYAKWVNSVTNDNDTQNSTSEAAGVRDRTNAICSRYMNARSAAAEEAE